MTKATKERATGRRRQSAWASRGMIALASPIVLARTLAPAARCGLGGQRTGRAAADARPADIPVRAVQFSASDGVKLSGWLAIARYMPGDLLRGWSSCGQAKD